MRVFSLAAVAIAFAFAACSDIASPIATGPDVTSPTAIGGTAHFFGGKKFDARGKHGHHDDDPQECSDDDDNTNDHHWGKRGHHHSRWHSRWGKHGHHDYRRGKRGHQQHHRGKGGHGYDDQTPEDCGGGDDGGSSEGTVATISGTVMNDGAGANGFPVFLLDAGGTAVVASTTTSTDGSGSYSFADVAPGTYLVCEADPFVEAYHFLGETTPEDGASCPSGYGPVGYPVTVSGGATAGGNDFENFGLL